MTRGTQRASRAELVAPIGIATVIVAVCMWATTRGVQGFATLGGALASLGHLAGLLAADLMILQVLLVARIPWVERAWGHDLLTRRHRMLGFVSFTLMLAHVGFVALRRTTRVDVAGAPHALWLVFVKEPWMLPATIGTVVLIAVVVTSIRVARRRLRYESWHLLHLYSYAGMGLALPHQLFDGMNFQSPLARAYWWAIYGVAVAAVLTFRLAVPLWRSHYHRLRVAEVKPEVPGVVSVTVEGHRLDRLRAHSGQFFVWRFRDGPGWIWGHPYTMSDAPDRDRLRVTIRTVGDGGRRAEHLRPGTRVLIEGPYGTMTAQRRRHPRMLVLAAGVGITPMRALIADTPFAPGDATLIYRYSAAADPVFREELEEIAARRGVELHFLPGSRADDDAWRPAGFAGDDVEALTRLVPDAAQRDIFVCGSPGWIAAVRRAARAAGASPKQIHAEEFAW